MGIGGVRNAQPLVGEMPGCVVLRYGCAAASGIDMLHINATDVKLVETYYVLRVSVSRHRGDSDHLRHNLRERVSRFSVFGSAES
jgi:hypothetical protein